MKKWSVLSQLSGVIPVAALAVVLVAGCGKRFEANSDGYAPVVPTTADPLTAEDQRRWEAASENKVQADPVLESDVEIKSFLEDMTGKAPTYSEEELAAEAERMHETRRKERSAGTSNSQPDRKYRRGPSRPARPATPSEGSKPRTTPNAPQTQGPSTSPRPNAPEQALPVEMPVAERETRPARPAATVGSKFCDSLNVTSGKGTADLSHLYNAQEVATTTIPSKELAKATSPEKKNRFVCLLLPAAIRMSEEVYRMRLEVIRLQAKSKRSTPLEEDEKNWLAQISKEYGASGTTNFEELLKRVDIIPLPLLLSQAAVESGWGTSKATKELNNIFGIHAAGNEPYKLGYDTNNAKMRVFPSVDAAISAYIRLLNTGTYFKGFRDERAQMRSKRQSLDPVALLDTLIHYSERRQEYISNLLEIMTKSNNLIQYVFKEDEVGAAQ